MNIVEQLILVVEGWKLKGNRLMLSTSPGKFSDLFDSLDLDLTAQDGLHAAQLATTPTATLSVEDTMMVEDTMVVEDTAQELKEKEKAAESYSGLSFRMARSVEEAQAVKAPMLLMLSPSGVGTSPLLCSHQREVISMSCSLLSDGRLDRGVVAEQLHGRLIADPSDA